MKVVNDNRLKCSDSPSAVVQVDDKSLVSKLFERLIMVTIHVSCDGAQGNNSAKRENGGKIK